MISRRSPKLHPYRLFFWSTALIVLLLGTLDRHPITIAAGDPELQGRPTSVEGRGDILVVLSEAGALAAGQNGEPDRSWVWVDLFAQEVGPVTTVQLADLTPEILQSHRTVVMTRSTAWDPTADDHLDHLETFAANGGMLALELPTGLIRARFGADGAGGWRRADAITAAEGVPPDVMEDIRSVPLLTRYLGSTSPAQDAETLLAIDGAPVIYDRRVGSGDVIVFDFEVGAQISRMQQGTPDRDGRARPRRHGQPLRTFDLASTPALLSSTIPYADLLERYIAHAVIGFRNPLFSLWPYPDGTRGAVVTSHDSRRHAGRPLWMSIHERSLGARSTTFVAAPSGTVEEMAPFPDAEFVGHAAMLWVLEPEEEDLYRRYGLFGFHPVRQTLTLVGQLERLEELLGDDADVRGVRIWDSRWTERATDPYRVMDAAELRYSTTYSPAPGGPPGYIFGTCQPYTPLDVSGNPFRLQEVPICFANPETDQELELFDEALTNAAEDVWAVHILTSADRFIERPDLHSFDIWRDALRYADANDMWVGGAGELVSFRRRRSNTALNVISTEISSTDADGEPRVVEYTVEVETSGRGQVLMIPDAYHGLTFDQATRGGPEAQLYDVAGQVETETVTYLGRQVRLLPLNPGFTTVGIRYRR